MYIVIEGQDATGKSTQVELLAEYLRKKTGKKVITMHEPDGDLDSAHELRKIIKDKNYNLEPLTHVLLFTAARKELWRKLAEPVLKEGGFVISARNWWSTLAYQGYGQGISRSKIIRITKEAMPDQYVNPDKSVILTLEDSIRLSRQTGRDDNSKNDTFESKSMDFQHKVDHAYLNIAKDFNIPTFDASPSIEEIHAELIKLFEL
ncbi:dTMP kinase [Candidatus Saccharibacteria bacterium]|nr:dTMP kinase [Candidatus Saccharibacteria bacterium]